MTISLQNSQGSHARGLCVDTKRLEAGGSGVETPSSFQVGAAQRALVEPVPLYKRQLDRRIVARAVDGAKDDPWLIARGFVKKPAGTGIGTEQFARWIFGRFWYRNHETELCEVPAWACIGWNRRQRARVSPDAAAAIAQDLNQQTLYRGHQRATGTWFAPFPLVLIGEGKHRVDLFAEHDLHLLIRLTRSTLAPPISLRLKRVLGCDDVVALECGDSSFCGGSHRCELLPLPDLAVPLLEAYGVRWAAGRHLLTPRDRALRHAADHPNNDPTRGIERWRPRSWRSMLLSQAYV